MQLLTWLVNPAVIGLGALFLAIVWMLRDETDRTRPLLVIALVVNLFYGFLLSFVMGRENGLVPWKYDYVLARLDEALGITAAPIAARLQGWARIPLMVVYQLMVPMMVAWFLVVRRYRKAGPLVLTYVVEMMVGPALYALVPGCGPIYAFRAAWLATPAVRPEVIRLSGMPNAFPSLHLGTALVFVLFARGWIWRVVALAFLAGTALATLSTGEHYVIDLVAGAAFGCFAAAAGQRRWASSLLFGAITVAWSILVRAGHLWLIGHPEVVRVCAAGTVMAAVAGVWWMWKDGD
jgi:hypothetical protein